MNSKAILATAVACLCASPMQSASADDLIYEWYTVGNNGDVMPNDSSSNCGSCHEDMASSGGQSWRDLIINMVGKKRIIPCEIKIVGDPLDPLSLDVEHDALVKLQKALKTRKKELSLGELRTAIESRLQTSGRKIILDL